MHSPEEGVYLFIHTPSGNQFAVVGNKPELYLKDCEMFPVAAYFTDLDRPNHLDVLTDFKVNTRYNFSEFVFRIKCPTQMEWLLDFIKDQACLEIPEITISEDMFNHVYKLEASKVELVINKDSGYVFCIHEETGLKIAANVDAFNNPKDKMFKKFKQIELDSLTVNKFAYVQFPPGISKGFCFYAQELDQLQKVIRITHG